MTDNGRIQKPNGNLEISNRKSHCYHSPDGTDSIPSVEWREEYIRNDGLGGRNVSLMSPTLFRIASTWLYKNQTFSWFQPGF